MEEEETRVLDDLLDLLLSQGMCGSAGSLPPLTTSQSDSALHNRTRIDSSPSGGVGDDAWSLPSGGVTSSAALFPANAASSPTPLVGSAPAQFVVDAARIAVGAEATLLGAEAALPGVASMDDSLDAGLSPSKCGAASTLRSGRGDIEADDGEEASRHPLPNEFRTSPSPSRHHILDAQPTNLPNENDADETMSSSAAAAATNMPPDTSSAPPLQSSLAETNASHNSFMTHRAQTSGASEVSYEKSRSSSGHSNLSGGGVVSAANPAPSAAAAAASAATATTLNNNPFALLNQPAEEAGKEEEEEEDDKENLSPMGDLSVSADGAAMMLVESMDVVVAELEESQDDCRR